MAKKKEKKINFSSHKLILYVGIIFILVIFGIKLGQLEQLPGPPFGGDIYRDNGMILNIMEKGHPFSSSYFNDAAAYYSWLPFIVVALLASLGIPLLKAHIFWLPLIEITISIFIFYYCSKYFFKDKKLSAAAALFMASMGSLSFSPRLILPALLLLFITHFLKLMEEKKQGRSDIYAGITLGIISLVRFSEFFTMIIVASLFILFKFIFEKNYSKEAIINYVKKYWRMYVFSVGITLLMLIPILIQHQFVVKNPVFEYGEHSFDVRGWGWMFTVMKNSVFNFSSLNSFIFSFLTLLGFISFFVVKKRKSLKPLLFFFFVPMVLSQHYHITKPLFNKWFLPDKFMVYGYLMPVIIIFGISFILLLLRKYTGWSSVKKYSTLIVTVVVILLFLFSFDRRMETLDNDRWYEYGTTLNPQIEAYYQLGDWLRKNVGEDEVILAGDETSFMLNGISGKKVVSSRRTHVSYYVNIEQRVSDTAVMFYGNNNELRKELIEKYNIKYMYYDFYLQSQPMRTTVDNKEYLESNGVQVIPVKERLDIAYADAKVFDLVLIPPQNISSELIEMVDPVLDVKVGNQQLGVLFKFKE